MYTKHPKYAADAALKYPRPCGIALQGRACPVESNLKHVRVDTGGVGCQSRAVCGSRSLGKHGRGYRKDRRQLHTSGPAHVCVVRASELVYSVCSFAIWLLAATRFQAAMRVFYTKRGNCEAVRFVCWWAGALVTLRVCHVSHVCCVHAHVLYSILWRCENSSASKSRALIQRTGGMGRHDGFRVALNPTMMKWCANSAAERACAVFRRATTCASECYETT